MIRYACLWKREADCGQIEGQKHRPCVVVLCVEEVDGEKVVTVVPITHGPGPNPEQTTPRTQATRRRLGLDEERNWIMATELHSFFWPVPDLAPTPTGQYAFVAVGQLVLRVGHGDPVPIMAAKLSANHPGFC